MNLKKLMMSGSVLMMFGLVSFAHASDFPVSCAKNDGGEKDCVSISNNTNKNMDKLSVMCDTQKGHYYWKISIDAGTQNQCLNLDDRCKIPQMMNKKKHKVTISVNKEWMSTTCNWPDEA